LRGAQLVARVRIDARVRAGEVPRPGAFPGRLIPSQFRHLDLGPLVRQRVIEPSAEHDADVAGIELEDELRGARRGAAALHSRGIELATLQMIDARLDARGEP